MAGIGTCQDTAIILPTVFNGSPIIGVRDNAFNHNQTITSVLIPAGYKYISSYAFADCPNLERVIISEGVTSVGSYAFYNSTALTDITIPASVASFGAGAFQGCTSLNSVHIEDIAAWCNMTYKDDTYSRPFYYARNLYLNDALITEIDIPNEATSISAYAFAGCSGLTRITIPDSVTSIGKNAFDGCSSLEYNVYDNAYYLGNDGNPYLLLVRATDSSIVSCDIPTETKLLLTKHLSIAPSLKA